MKVTRRDFFVSTAVGAVAASAGGEAPSPVSPEVTDRYDWIMAKWGGAFTDAQKADLRRLLSDNEKALAILRAYPMGNDVEPAR